jgi:hypothetical protein
MQVDMKKLDARIQKLQDIRRIAADPELVNLLLDFISTEDERKEVVPPAKTHLNPSAPSADDIELVDRVLKGLEPQPKGNWNVKRA